MDRPSQSHPELENLPDESHFDALRKEMVYFDEFGVKRSLDALRKLYTYDREQTLAFPAVNYLYSGSKHLVDALCRESDIPAEELLYKVAAQGALIGLHTSFQPLTREQQKVLLMRPSIVITGEAYWDMCYRLFEQAQLNMESEDLLSLNETAALIAGSNSDDEFDPDTYDMVMESCILGYILALTHIGGLVQESTQPDVNF